MQVTGLRRHHAVLRPPGRVAGEGQLSGYTFDPATVPAAPSLAWWQDYRLHSSVLALLAIALVCFHA
jgi:hypothetical protein